MEFRVLGPVQAWAGDRRLVLGGAQRRALLALLLLHANRVVAAERLVDLLWGATPPKTARSGLQWQISKLRQALAGAGDAGDAAGRLVYCAPGYLLRVAPGELDLERFQRLADDGRRALDAGDAERAGELLRAALALWRGSAFEDSEVAGLVEPRARLERRRLAALEDRIEADLRRGRHAELVGELEALVAAHPLRERLRAQLMLALYRCGRQADALAAYQDARRALVEELGVEPGRPLQEMQRQILAADPALDPPQRPGRVARAAVPVPRQLPPDIVSFTGREAELAKLEAVLTATGQPGPVVSAINGPAGIGKSALAIHAAHRVAERFPDGQLYVNLRGATPGLAPLTPLDALGSMLRSLGLDPAAVPAEVQEAAAQLRSLLAGRRVLLVLDNAASSQQVGPLLPGGPGCAVLITSRQALVTVDAADPIHLDLMAPEEAVTLLGRLAGRQRVAAEPEAAAEVAGWCGHLPLAIRIAGARLAARPAWPIRTLAERLADATHRLAELRAGELAVRASFDVSLDALRHSPDPTDRAAAAAFGLLSLPDGPDIGSRAAARLLDQPEPAAEALLERLADAQLVETPRPGRYQFHDLVRLHAREHAARHHPVPARMAALTRVLHFYTATAWRTLQVLRPRNPRLAEADPRWAHGGLELGDPAEAVSWLEAERANLLAAISQAAAAPLVPAKLAGELTKALFGMFDGRGYRQDGVRANHTALALARRERDLAAQADAHTDLGAIYERLGRLDEAVACQRTALTIRRELGDLRGQAVNLDNLGIAYDKMGRPDDAIASLRESLALSQALGDRWGQANSLTGLGIAYQHAGRYDEAAACQREGLALRRALGDRHGQAGNLANLGNAYQLLGRYDEAAACQREGLALCREMGDRHGQAHILNNLGIVHHKLGQTADAIACQQSSLELFRQLDDPYGQGEALRDLGDALDAAGEGQQARVVWRQAMEIFERLRSPVAGELRARLGA